MGLFNYSDAVVVAAATAAGRKFRNENCKLLDTHPYGLAIVCLMVNTSSLHLDGHPGDLLCMGWTLPVQPTCYTVSVPYRLYLIKRLYFPHFSL